MRHLFILTRHHRKAKSHPSCTPKYHDRVRTPSRRSATQKWGTTTTPASSQTRRRPCLRVGLDSILKRSRAISAYTRMRSSRLRMAQDHTRIFKAWRCRTREGAAIIKGRPVASSTMHWPCCQHVSRTVVLARISFLVSSSCIGKWWVYDRTSRLAPNHRNREVRGHSPSGLVLKSRSPFMTLAAPPMLLTSITPFKRRPCRLGCQKP